jgi:hypothetical protein
VGAVPVPVDTRLRHDVGDGGNVVGPGHDVHREAAGQVPGDVAVEWPDAWVVGFELDGGEATGADGLDIAASGVLLVADATVPGADAFVEDVHVVAVKMESEILLVLINQSETCVSLRMSEGSLVGDIENNSVVLVEVVDSPLRLERV